jgi:hypothetical protein
LTEDIDADCFYQRRGERVGDDCVWSLLAIARAVATIVAVVPTLDFKSQVSLSLRIMLLPSLWCLHR